MKRKWLIWSVGICVAVLLLIFFYFLWEPDADRISPVVRLSSYQERLLEAIADRSGKKTTDLSDAEMIEYLSEIGLARGMQAEIRAASVRMLARYADQRKAVETIATLMADSSSIVSAEAIMAVGREKIREAEPALARLIERLQVDPDRSIPLSDMEYISMTGEMTAEDIQFDFREAQNARLAFDNDSVYEINLFLPQGAYYYLSFPNFDDNWEEFIESDWIESFQELPAYSDLMDIRPFRDLRRLERQLEERFGGLSRYFVPERLFRDDLKYARFPEGSLIVTFAGRNIEIALSLFELFGGIGGERYSLKKTGQFGTTVYSIVSPRSGRGLVFTHTGEYFLLSDSPDLLERSLRTFTEDRFMSITANPAFQQTYSTLDLTGENQFCYLFCRPQTALKAAGRTGSARYLLKLAVAVSRRLHEGEPARESSRTQGGGDIRRRLYTAIPEDALSYCILDAFDPASFWRYILDHRALSVTAIDSLQTGSGVDIHADLVPLLAPGGFLSYSGIRYGADYQSNISVLKGVIGISTRGTGDPTRPLSRLFAYLFRNPPVEESYFGNRLSVCSVYREEGAEGEGSIDRTIRDDDPLTPCFAVTEDGILLSMNSGILKHHLDAYASRTASSFPDGLRAREIEEKVILRTTPVLTDFYSFLRRYARRTTRYTDREVEERIRPLFALLEKCRSIHGWFKEYDTVFHGRLTCDMVE